MFDAPDVLAVGWADAATSGIWAPTERPIPSSAGVDTMECDDGR
jgi:hypothetical protein